MVMVVFSCLREYAYNAESVVQEARCSDLKRSGLPCPGRPQPLTRYEHCQYSTMAQQDDAYLPALSAGPEVTFGLDVSQLYAHSLMGGAMQLLGYYFNWALLGILHVQVCEWAVPRTSALYH